MQVLVTGGTGFLGGHLCSELARAGHSVAALGSKNADLTRPHSLEPWDITRFDQIWHLAAWTQAGDFCLRHPGEQWIINQQINTNVLTWWQRVQPQAKLICIGTSCSYDPRIELTEDHYLIGQPIDGLYTYAMTKRMLQIGLLALNEQYGFRYLTLVPSTLYGPGYHTDGRQMHFIFDLIRKILRGKHRGEPVVLWGDGYQKREVVYVGDFTRVAVQLAETLDNDLVNLGAGEEFTIREFAKLICDRVGYDVGAVDFDTTRYVGAKSKCLSVDKLRRLLPDMKVTPLGDGLSDTIDWFRRNSAF